MSRKKSGALKKKLIQFKSQESVADVGDGLQEESLWRSRRRSKKCQQQAFVNVFTTATTTTNHLKTHHHFLATSDLKSFGSKDSTAITHQNLR